MVEENSYTSGVFSGLPYTKVAGKVEDIVLALPVNDSSSMKNCDGSHNISLQGKEPTFNENQQIYSISAENLEYTGSCLLHEDLSPELLNVYTLTDITSDNLAGSNDRLPQPKPDTLSSILEPYPETNSPLSFWSNCPLDLETMKMDDVFQVDKDDLVQSPTLAELNANDESLFDSFDNFDTIFPSEQMSQRTKCVSSASDEQYGSVFDFSAVCNTNIRIPLDEKEKFQNVPGNVNLSYCKELETAELDIKYKSESSLQGGEVKLQTVPTSAQSYEMQSTTDLNDLSDVHDHCKVKMETSSEESKTIAALTKEHELEQQILVQDDPESDEESELDCDYSTEAESEDEGGKRDENADEVLLEKKKKRYFWQYNVQSKGPKTMKLSINGKCGTSDPVFNAECSDKGVKHAGKARRGDGNDLTPNPKKLYHIGLELKKLNSVIDELIPANELPLNARINSRKEKNKLASRACRLKKKAQHEANKLKLFGLQQERKHLLLAVTKAKKLIKKRIQNGMQKDNLLLADVLESFIISGDTPKVAGCSADFVNNALKKVGTGDETGGLNLVESS